MKEKRDKGQLGANPTGTGPTGRDPAKVVAVGELAPESLPVGRGVEIIAANLQDLCRTRLANWRPRLVLSPLVAERFDCFDVAERLVAAGYCARYRAVVDVLPDTSVVRREIAAQFPRLDFDVLMLGVGPLLI